MDGRRTKMLVPWSSRGQFQKLRMKTLDDQEVTEARDRQSIGQETLKLGEGCFHRATHLDPRFRKIFRTNVSISQN